ncbi:MULTISPECIES: type I toxin-antitoxin system Ibs family toxin [Enterobacteriaceae]|nr:MULTISPECIES: type I toxin-antitoxin system Ibs family toxin [Escherichia]EFN6913458.1 type I toxin-antitoxin system Ibs family toxin [Escherichia coli O10]EFB2830016.1 type I toxin-antitoxin system Ibs family toxin [Escherichia coli]EFC1528526.1 type I toxin-antitoxin system Ibs family toxin [Escherichia coli]EFC9524679.1 type I toxin-antitoxin system Ibs family toxin [Escherichia coli]EFD1055274.1 type I toxin-antitoxin system Ibs family toxin [Escherichia coli]
MMKLVIIVVLLVISLPAY